MGKVNYRPTGSKLLGEELRRLRGSRTLQQIVDLSRSDAFAGRIRSIAEPTLSQLENGISMPTLESLHTLAVVYRVSAQRLLNIVAEERLAGAVTSPATEEECEHAVLRALAAGHALDALAHARQGAQITKDSSRRAAWTIHQARALQPLGMVDEAISLLGVVVDRVDVDAAVRLVACCELAQAHLRSGNLTVAGLFIEKAGAMQSSQGEDRGLLVLLQARIQWILTAHEMERGSGESELRDVIRMSRECRRIDVSMDRELIYDCYAAAATALLGNAAVALRDLAEIVRTARSRGLPAVEMTGHLITGTVLRRRERAAEAVRSFDRAADIASELKDADAAFEAHYELSILRASEPDKAAFHARKCERYLPLVSARTPNVMRYEQTIGARS